jgi:hypothetical protein
LNEETPINHHKPLTLKEHCNNPPPFFSLKRKKEKEGGEKTNSNHTKAITPHAIYGGS